MLLAIDVGNTNMVFGIFAGEELTHSFRLTTDADRTSDEIGLLVWEYFSASACGRRTWRTSSSPPWCPRSCTPSPTPS